MSRYNRCGDCYNMKCIFVTGERTDFDSSECADFRSMTNADRIRQMSDEELAFLIGNGCPPACVKPCREYLSVDGDTNCTDCWLDWLKSPAEEVDNGT